MAGDFQSSISYKDQHDVWRTGETYGGTELLLNMRTSQNRIRVLCYRDMSTEVDMIWVTLYPWPSSQRSIVLYRGPLTGTPELLAYHALRAPEGG